MGSMPSNISPNCAQYVHWDHLKAFRISDVPSKNHDDLTVAVGSSGTASMAQKLLKIVFRGASLLNLTNSCLVYQNEPIKKFTEVIACNG